MELGRNGADYSPSSPTRPRAITWRSHSLPRLASSGGDSATHPTAPADRQADPRFRRAAETLAGCQAAIKELAKQANGARVFREKCSLLLGHGLEASLALTEAVSSESSTSHAHLQQLGSEVQQLLLQAVTLVRKYGHSNILEQLLRAPSKKEVEAKFDQLTTELTIQAGQAWDCIDPGNRMKLRVLAQQQVRAMNRGSAFSRQRLRFASSHKVHAMLVFPDEDGDVSDGLVCWASHRGIKMVSISSEVTTMVAGAGDAPPITALAYDRQGALWSGHQDGTARLWSVEHAGAAASPVKVSNTSITALAVDMDSGYCWCGTSDGEIGVVRCKGSVDSSSFGRLELVRLLLGYDAHTPTAGGVTGSSVTTVGSSGSVGSLEGSHPNGFSTQGKSLLGLHHSKSTEADLAKQGSKPGGLRGGLELLESCLGQGQQQRRLRAHTVHKGAVTCISIMGGRAYTAGGSSRSTCELLVWNSTSCELLRTISKRSTTHFSLPVTAMTLVPWWRMGRGTPTGVEAHLVTGHADGRVLVWDPSHDTLKPVQQVDGKMGKPVRAVGVCEELALLVVGHSNGKVYLRKLDPTSLHAPKGEHSLPNWNPTTVSLSCHGLGLSHMGCGGHLLVTGGASGSIKVWPEVTLRCMATEAGIPLSKSKNIVAEELNNMLNGTKSYSMSRAGSLITGQGRYPSLSLQPSTSAAVAAAYEAHMERALSSTAGPGRAASSSSSPCADGLQRLPQSTSALQRHQQHPQPHRHSVSSGAVLGQGDREVGEGDRGQLQQQLQLDGPLPQGEGSQEALPGDVQQQQQPGPSGGSQEGGRGDTLTRWQRLKSLQRQSSGTWPRGIQHSDWMLDYSQIKIKHRIGEGSFGRVSVASLHETEVAVKELTGANCHDGQSWREGEREIQWDDDLLRELSQEVDILATIHHPNVVLFMGVILSPPCVVTEFCPLGSLFDVLRKARREAGFAEKLTWGRRLLMALDAAKGMLYLHQHRPVILHRDLKSPNLFVMQNFSIKVGDFNLSRYLGRDSSFLKSSRDINPRWSAPEVILHGHFSKSADVYSFAIVMWELLTWQEPWEGPGNDSILSVGTTPQQHQQAPITSFQIMSQVQQGERPHIPPPEQLPRVTANAEALAAYVALMASCWAQDPEQRPRFEQVIKELRRILVMSRPVTRAGQQEAVAAGEGAQAGPGLALAQRNTSEGAMVLNGPPGGPHQAATGDGNHRRSLSETAAAGAGDASIGILIDLGEDDAAAGVAPQAAAAAAVAVPRAGAAARVEAGGPLSPWRASPPLPLSAALPPVGSPCTGWANPRVSPFAAAAFPAAVAIASQAGRCSNDLLPGLAGPTAAAAAAGGGGSAVGPVEALLGSGPPVWELSGGRPSGITSPRTSPAGVQGLDPAGVAGVGVVAAPRAPAVSPFAAQQAQQPHALPSSSSSYISESSSGVGVAMGSGSSFNTAGTSSSGNEATAGAVMRAGGVEGGTARAQGEADDGSSRQGPPTGAARGRVVQVVQADMLGDELPAPGAAVQAPAASVRGWAPFSQQGAQQQQGQLASGNPFAAPGTLLSSTVQSLSAWQQGQQQQQVSHTSTPSYHSTTSFASFHVNGNTYQQQQQQVRPVAGLPVSSNGLQLQQQQQQQREQRPAQQVYSSNPFAS